MNEKRNDAGEHQFHLAIVINVHFSIYFCNGLGETIDDVGCIEKIGYDIEM